MSPRNSRSTAFRLPAIVAALFLAGACDESVTDPPDGGNVVGVVTGNGGTVQTTGGAVKLVFPSGALNSTTPITVEATAQFPADPLVVSGAVYEFGPSGTQFSSPVELSIAYNTANLPGGAPESTLGLYKAVGGGWQLVPGSSVNTTTKRVEASITSFSIYGVKSAGAPGSMTVQEGDEQSAPAGSALPLAPAVVVRTSAGVGLAGIAVTFAVTQGGGSIAGGNVVTDAQGIARAGTWTLGANAGANAVAATTAGLPDVVFTATAQALNVPVTLAKHEGDEQSAPAGANVATAPAVIVRNAAAAPLAGVSVTFTVTQGGGSVTGGTAVTDAQGIARVGSWQLGGTAGANALQASVTGLAPVGFTATGIDACAVAPAYTVGTSVQGELTATDCLDSNGRRVDYHRFTVASNLSVTLEMSATGFTPFIGAVDASGTQIVTQYTSNPGFTRAVLAPGEYRVAARSVEVGATGSYSFVVTQASHDVEGCGVATNVFITAGASDSGQLTAGDCVDEQGDPLDRFDTYAVYLRAGEIYQATLTATDAKMTLFGPAVSGGLERKDFASASGEVKLTYTAELTGYYTLYPLGRPGVSYQISIAQVSAADPCTSHVAYTLGTSRGAFLGPQDCKDSSGRPVDRYAFTTSTQRSLLLQMQTGDFTPFIGIEDAGGKFRISQYASNPGWTRAIVAPGSYRITARPTTADAKGIYWLGTSETSHAADGCGVATNIWVMPGVNDSGSITSGDCVSTVDAEDKYDTYVMWLEDGASYSFTLTTNITGFVDIWASAGGSLKWERTTGAGTVTLTYTAAATGFYPIFVGGRPGLNYQIAFAQTGGMAGAAAPGVKAPALATQLDAPTRGAGVPR